MFHVKHDMKIEMLDYLERQVEYFDTEHLFTNEYSDIADEILSELASIYNKYTE